MWQAGWGVVGTIVLLELVTAGGLKGGQNQGRVGDPTEAGVIGAAGPECAAQDAGNERTGRL